MGVVSIVGRRITVAMSIAMVSLTTVLVTQLSAWTTEDPTRAIVYEGKPGTHGLDVEAIENPSAVGRGVIATDSSGNVYTIIRSGGELSIGPGSESQTVGTLATISTVLTKTDANGNLEWYRLWTGTSFTPSFVKVIGSSLYVAGMVYSSSYLDPTGTDTDAYVPSTGVSDGVILEFTSSGSYVGHVAISGSSNSEIEFTGLEASLDGNLIVYGQFKRDATFPGATPRTISSDSASQDGFVAQIGVNDGLTDWVFTASGTIDGDQVDGVVVLEDGSLFVLGNFVSSSLTLTGSDSATQTVTKTGSSASFLAQLTANGVVSTSAARQTGAWNMFYAGNDAVIVQYLDSELRLYGSPLISAAIGNLGMKVIKAIRTADGRFRLAGYANSSFDADIGSGVNTITPVNTDAYLLTLSPTYMTESVQVFSGPTTVYNIELVSLPDGGFMLMGHASQGTLNFSNTTHNGTFTSSAGMSHFMYLIRYDAAGTTGTTTTTIVPTVTSPAQASYSAGNKRVTVKWSAVDGASSYVVTTSSGEVKCTSASTSCVVSSLKNGKSYTYYVFAVNNAGVRSVDSRIVKVVPGFNVKSTSFKVKKKPNLSSIVTTPSKGSKSWSVISGKCRISGSRLVMPTKSGSCRLRLSVTKRGSYPAMTTTIKISVTR